MPFSLLMLNEQSLVLLQSKDSYLLKSFSKIYSAKTFSNLQFLTSEMPLLFKFTNNSSFKPMGKPKESITYFEYDRSWGFELAEFIDAIKGTATILHGTSQDALEIMKIVDHVYNN